MKVVDGPFVRSGTHSEDWMFAMVIALLAVLGVDLILIVTALGGFLARRRWLSRRPGVFQGIARVLEGEVDQLGGRPRRGYGRWVRDVLVWTPRPLCLRNALAPVDGVLGVSNPKDQVRRLGDDPKVVTLVAPGLRIEITVPAEHVVLVTAPFQESPAVPGRSRDGARP